tara:strand:+ start:358 stop:624 length:267 start_codon:yes stop_codon:yes gene_type:complete
MVKIKKQGRVRRFRLEFKTQLKIALMAAFGFLIALSWRDFLSEAVNHLITSLGLSGDLYLYKLISAIIITAIAVIGILIISKFSSEDK